MRSDQVLTGVDPPKEPTALQKALQVAKAAAAPVVAKMREVSDSPHMAPIHAAIRQGADEIAQVLPAFPAGGVTPSPEPGQLFEVTPQEAFAEKTGREIGRQRDIEMDR